MTRHGVSGEGSARKRVIFSVIAWVNFPRRRLKATGIAGRSPKAAPPLLRRAGLGSPNANRNDHRHDPSGPARPALRLAQTAWIYDPVTPSAQARSAKVGVGAWHHAR